jgi:hypothetical protein
MIQKNKEAIFIFLNSHAPDGAQRKAGAKYSIRSGLTLKATRQSQQFT